MKLIGIIIVFMIVGLSLISDVQGGVFKMKIAPRSTVKPSIKPSIGKVQTRVFHGKSRRIITE